MILSLSDARDLAAAAMAAAGHDPQESAIIADHLIDCELRGLAFGGLARALSVVERVEATASPRRPITLVRKSHVSATFDGGDQVGYLVAHQATNTALAMARESGIAVVGAYDTWYTGMLSYYLERVTEAGFVGIAAGSGAQIVAPHGGTQGRYGTNPIAFGFPTQGEPIIWDIGTSDIMLGEVLVNLRLGRPLPEGKAFDRDGAPTVDPMAALGGAFAVWGGHKGSGLAMVVQLLGMLAGAPAAPVGISGCGFTIVVIDPDLLGPAEDFRSRAGEYADSIRATRPVDPGVPVRVPFDRSAAQRARRLAEGTLDVPDAIAEALIALRDGRRPEPGSAASVTAAVTAAALAEVTAQATAGTPDSGYQEEDSHE